MATITLPLISANEQQELLVQTLAGIRSALDEQGAELIVDTRWNPAAPHPHQRVLGCNRLTVNGESTVPGLKRACIQEMPF